MRTKSARELKHEALVLTAQGRKQTAVAQELGLSTRTIQRASEKLRRYGDIEGGAKKRGPKGKLHEGMIEVRPVPSILTQALIAMVHYEPSATLSEYAEALEEQFGVTVSTARLCQIFATHDINFKKVFF
jgi:transposase